MCSEPTEQIEISGNAALRAGKHIQVRIPDI